MSSASLPGLSLEHVTLQAPAAQALGVPVFLGYGRQDVVPWLSGPLGSWSQFQSQAIQTGYTGDVLLGGAVQGFFACGGAQCHVVLLSQADRAAAWTQAVASLVELDAVDLLCAPSLMSPDLDVDAVAVQAQLLEVCHQRGDCFAILDAPRVPTAQALGSWLDALFARVGDEARLRNGALYFPWLSPDGEAFLPPCGHLAGTYARSDGETGPHRAPANQLLADVVELDTIVDDAMQLEINQGRAQPIVNCIRAFPGRGIRAWGARTLARSDATWSFISTRRLFIAVTRYLARATAWAAFEPNNLILWARLTRQIQEYCLTLYRRGALKGASAAQAFYIKCDDETNPPAARDQGQVVVEIGLAPAFPAEFVRVRLTQAATGATVAAAG